jgi:multidrug efflux pump subunit AcrA (membrane-fusion protein)
VNPDSGEVFEFGEEELFLLRSVDEAASEEALCRSFAERFGMTLEPDGLREFCRSMESYGLLTDCSGAEEESEQSESATAWEADADDDAGPRKPYRYPLFNPDRLFGRLSRLLHPVRHLGWLLVPGIPGALMLLLNNQSHFIADMGRLLSLDALGSLLLRILISLVTVNLVSKFMQGIVTVHFGGRVEQFGIRMAFGVRPRFYVNKGAIWRLHRSGRLWGFGTPLLTRLAIFVLGTVIWFLHSPYGSALSSYALWIGLIGLASFLFTANPLWRADGYSWLITYMNTPRLRERAFRLLVLKLTSRPPPEAMSMRQRSAMLAYGVASVVYVSVVVGTAILFLGVLLEDRFQGTGVVIFLILLGLVVRWSLVRLNNKGLRQGRRGGAALHADTASTRLQWRGSGRLTVWVRWGLLLGAAALIGMIPYPFEVGGIATVKPAARGEARARSTGEVVAVHVRERDWVEKDTVVAELESWDQEHQLALTGEAPAQKQGELALLLHGPKAEAIALAEEEVNLAAVRVIHSDRQEQMLYPGFRDGSVSALEYEKAAGLASTNRASEQVARAELTLTKAPPLEMEVAITEAEVRQLESQVAYQRGILDRTKVRSPITGRLVSANLEYLLGNFLREGDLFSVVEDNRIVIAEIQVPEVDIVEVAVGSPVELRVWSDPTRPYYGEVKEVAPLAEDSEENPFVRVVRVTSEIDNGEGNLKSGMTGYAKVHAGDKPLAVAFGRALIRFFRIEVWSWLP